MKIEYLINLVTLFNEKSINSAALKLEKSPITLKKELTELEVMIEKRLFITTKKGVVFTRDGYKLYEYSRNIENIINSTKIKKEKIIKNFKIALDSKIMLGDILSNSYDFVSKAESEYGFIELNRDSVLKGVIDKKYSLGLVVKNKNENIDVYGEDLKFIKVADRYPVALISENHPLAVYEEISLSQLAYYERVTLENPFDNYFDYKYKLNENFNINRGKIKLKLMGDVYTFLKRYNFYFIVGTAYAYNNIIDGLKTLKIKEISDNLEIGYVYSVNNHIDLELSEFIATLK